MAYWLFKTEPGTYSWDDLVKDGRTCWEGVRNYQARNILRDEVKLGDLVFVYHSVVKPMVVAGVAEVVKEGYPDHFAFDPDSPYFDAKSDPGNPRWMMVDIAPLRALEPPVTRDELKDLPGLEDMMLLKKGSRLSVQPVSADEWGRVLALRGLDPGELVRR